MKKTLWIMCGIPASGKSWVAKKMMERFPNGKYISRDEIRFQMVRENEDYFSHEKEVFNEFVFRISVALYSEKVTDVIADATHLNYASRIKLLEALIKYDVNLSDINIIPVIVKADMEDILVRNKNRVGRECVPEDVIRSMNRSWKHPNTDPFRYDAIVEVNND